jgi:hypothetical protein
MTATADAAAVIVRSWAVQDFMNTVSKQSDRFVKSGPPVPISRYCGAEWLLFRAFNCHPGR